MTPKKILVVDDSEAARLLQATMLKAHRYAVVSASDGQQAIEKARAELPDLVLMDVVMPKMGGLEACRLLRAHPTTAHIPILIVTTHADDPDDVCKKTGANGYVTKPIDGPSLLARIRELFGEPV